MAVKVSSFAYRKEPKFGSRYQWKLSEIVPLRDPDECRIVALAELHPVLRDSGREQAVF